MRVFYFVLFIFFQVHVCAQSIPQKLLQAFAILDKDTCLRNADVSFCMLDIKTGKLIYEKNKDVLLAPASTLKTYTTAAALNLLGEDFQYKTRITFSGTIKNNIGTGTLIIYGSGDPSFGSERFAETKVHEIFRQILAGLKKIGIHKLEGNIIVNSSIFTDESINTHWLDEDIGNYYGAGLYALNWKENKFEITLKPTKTSFEVTRNTAGYHNQQDFCIELVHKEGATTEEAFAYVETLKSCRYNLKGVLSNKDAEHNMQLARLTPDRDFVRDLSAFLKKELSYQHSGGQYRLPEVDVCSISSPPLSKLVYWCNQKSLNLYAESFCKTIAVKLFKHGSWQLGISAMMRYASAMNIDIKKVNLKDACGLAEDNRITTSVLSEILQRQTKDKTYNTFYASLPGINGLNMKSGYIGGTRSYAGYITLPDSTQASFAFFIHGYTCSPREVKMKMFQVLDKLK